MLKMPTALRLYLANRAEKCTEHLAHRAAAKQ